MKAEIKFELIDEKIGNEDVAGVVGLDLNPSEILKPVLQMIEAIASPKVAVLFVDPDILDLFNNCDWLIGGEYDGQILVASDTIDEDKFDGNVW